MTMGELVEQYVAYRRSLGEKCETNARLLRAFCRGLRRAIHVQEVTGCQTRRYLYGAGPVTRAWHVRYNALKGFFSYAVSRGYAKTVPLPEVIPERPPPFVPFIYSRAEVRRLLQAALTYQRRHNCIEPETVRTILLLLYATGLRVSEAVALNRGDVDFTASILTVVRSKCFKSRLVPFAPGLSHVLQNYLRRPGAAGSSVGAETPFFTSRRGDRINQYSFEYLFRLVRQKAGVCREETARYQPRLHDLRHTFAVHRLTSWYRGGKDVQHLLPQLSVYLGHAHLADTQVYLTMTTELLREAGQRFEKYATQKPT